MLYQPKVLAVRAFPTAYYSLLDALTGILPLLTYGLSGDIKAVEGSQFRS